MQNSVKDDNGWCSNAKPPKKRTDNKVGRVVDLITQTAAVKTLTQSSSLYRHTAESNLIWVCLQRTIHDGHQRYDYGLL